MVRTPAELLRNNVFRADYRVVGLCGEGQFSEVWKAARQADDAVVALKIVRDGNGHRSWRTAGARALLGLNHPRLAGVTGVHSYDGFGVIEMEYFDGTSLEAVISRYPRESQYGLREAVRWIASVLEGLDFVHSRGVIHGDVKPGNILVNLATGEVKLIDFGSSRCVGSSAVESEYLTGTWEYQAPETIDRGQCSVASDIYSVGAVLYHLATLSKPYTTLPDLVQRRPFPSARELNSNVPESLDGVIARALARIPRARYRSAEMMMAALTGSLQVAAMARHGSRQSAQHARQLRRFLHMGTLLGYSHAALVLEVGRNSACRDFADGEGELAVSIQSASGVTRASQSDNHLVELSSFADLAFNLRCFGIAAAAYREALSQLDRDRDGDGSRALLRHILMRLDSLYAARRTLPALSPA